LLAACLFATGFFNQAVRSQPCDGFGLILCGYITFGRPAWIFSDCYWKRKPPWKPSPASRMPQALTGVHFFLLFLSFFWKLHNFFLPSAKGFLQNRN